jgi:hypothetical protein
MSAGSTTGRRHAVSRWTVLCFIRNYVLVRLFVHVSECQCVSVWGTLHSLECGVNEQYSADRAQPSTARYRCGDSRSQRQHGGRRTSRHRCCQFNRCDGNTSDAQDVTAVLFPTKKYCGFATRHRVGVHGRWQNTAQQSRQHSHVMLYARSHCHLTFLGQRALYLMQLQSTTSRISYCGLNGVNGVCGVVLLRDSASEQRAGIWIQHPTLLCGTLFACCLLAC